MRTQARVEDLDPDLWDENDDAVVAPDITKGVRRSYPELIHCEPRWPLVSPDRASAANSGMESSQEEDMAAFKRRYAQIRAPTSRGGSKSGLGWLRAVIDIPVGCRSPRLNWNCSV
jgi:hypothetical protein